MLGFSSRYKDALEQTSAYNARLGFERKQRSPFLDSQTGVAQVRCHLWKSKLSRRAPAYPYQICSYPGRRWKRKPRERVVEQESEPVVEESPQGRYIFWRKLYLFRMVFMQGIFLYMYILYREVYWCFSIVAILKLEYENNL